MGKGVERERMGDTGEKKIFSTAASLPKGPQQSDLSQVEIRSLELHLGGPHGSRGPKPLATLHRLPKHINRELVQNWRRWDSN